MKDIGINTVRVYTTNSTGDHDGCMQAFASQGIYVWVDLATPTTTIDRSDPKYTQALYDRYTAVIDAFAAYDNVLSFTAANELINSIDLTGLAPYVKAVVRDMKAFRDARGYRKIPISYSSSDVTILQLPTIEYLTCGDQDDAVELFGMNVYSWCGESDYQNAGYDEVYEQFQNVSIPAVFSEVGCNTERLRKFGEVDAILGSVFPAVFSGVVVYEWAEEASGYGLVNYTNSDQTGFPSELDDYDALGSVYLSATPVSTALSDYTPSNSPPSCPRTNSDWSADGSGSLPTVKAVDIATVTARTTYASSVSGASTGLQASAATASGSSGSSSPQQTAATQQSDGQSSLSIGAIAGIGIAVGAVVVGGLGGLIAWFFIRRRRNTRQRNEEKAALALGDANDDSNDFDKAELPASAAPALGPKAELESRNLYEAENTAVVRELDPTDVSRVHEMPGSKPVPQELGDTGVAREMKEDR